MTEPARRSWVVMRDPDQEVQYRFGSSERKRLGIDRAYESARVVRASTAQEAAEAYPCSVLDLRNGMSLIVFPMGEREARYHREYADKGGNEMNGNWPSNPVTLQR